MGLAARLGVLCGVVSLVLVPASAGAVKPIRGKLTKPGYTVIALASNGETRATRGVDERFNLKPPARKVTLHLRAPNGVYAGPVVAGREMRGRRAILGVKAGAALGEIDVRRGYAKLAEPPQSRWVIAEIRSRARKGVPTGARRFGRVRSVIPRAIVPGDPDFDGVPDALDIDDDGDLILDKVDRSAAGQAAQFAGERFDVNTALGLQLERTVNANAVAIDRADIDEALSNFGLINLEILSGGTPELDCAGSNQSPPRDEGLVYCSPGGSGIARADPSAFPQYWDGGAPFARPPFPDCCDDDGDGFGTMPQLPGAPGPGMALEHHATTAGIGTGNVLIQRLSDSQGVEIGSLTTTLGFVFATVPALVTYRDGATPANSVTPAYPVSSGGVGTQGNEFPVDVGCANITIPCTPGTDVVVELAFWRPQRERIPNDPPPGSGESGQWTDVGALNYQTNVAHVGELGSPGGETVQQPCPQNTHGTSDAELTTPPAHMGPGFTDTTADHPANPGRTITYTVNLTRCITALGASWESGEPASIAFVATVTRPGEADGTSQSVWFRRK